MVPGSTRADAPPTPVGPKRAESAPIDPDLDVLRELRVVLPTEMHRKLRSLKILRGANIGASVAEALEQYFEEREDLPAMARFPRPARAAEKTD